MAGPIDGISGILGVISGEVERSRRMDQQRRRMYETELALFAIGQQMRQALFPDQALRAQHVPNGQQAMTQPVHWYQQMQRERFEEDLKTAVQQMRAQSESTRRLYESEEDRNLRIAREELEEYLERYRP